MTFKCYDTCSLLIQSETLFENLGEDILLVPSIVLDELENIKTSSSKDIETKISARKVLQKLNNNSNKYKIILYQESMVQNIINNFGFSLTNDLKIIACVLDFSGEHPEDEIIFVTNDLLCKHIAKIFFNKVEEVIEENFDYDGYKEIYLTPNDMANFYTLNIDIYKSNRESIINEYLLIYDEETGKCVDRLCWKGDGYKHLSYDNFNSKFFGQVRPMKDDVYQQLAADSLTNNKITMIKGPAGSGKTYLSLGFLLHKLEKGHIDKIIVFCNTVATKNSAKLGYYPGTRDEKLLDSQIGNLLISKLGGRFIVETMIENEELVLLPMSDIRGYDTSGMKAGIYISEAQNLDIDLMKLTLQRIGEDSICIIDGDCKTQVDDIHFAGSNNGMKRASKVFRGHDIYGEVTLKNIHRSRIASIAENM